MAGFLRLDFTTACSGESTSMALVVLVTVSLPETILPIIAPPEIYTGAAAKFYEFVYFSAERNSHRLRLFHLASNRYEFIGNRFISVQRAVGVVHRFHVVNYHALRYGQRARVHPSARNLIYEHDFVACGIHLFESFYFHVVEFGDYRSDCLERGFVRAFNSYHAPFHAECFADFGQRGNNLHAFVGKELTVQSK